MTEETIRYLASYLEENANSLAYTELVNLITQFFKDLP